MKFFLAAASLSLGHALDWAVLLAGSQSWGNYRHQSDVCHAYQVTHKFGIPDERIIVMQFDDLAKNPVNPFPGKVINHPTDKGTPGIDVYAGCKTDYSGKAVTPDNFVAVLTGDASKTGGRPVLQSGAGDRVFINFVDHGGTGIIAFPDGSLMQASTLNDALKTMYKKQMYSKLVFYMEACESGSMFEGILPTNLNIYVTTASNAAESSWGTYCPPDDMVDGKSLNTCLGDLYSVNWLENADSVGATESLQDQFEEVKQATTQSHVMQYGDLTFTSEQIGDFLGDNATKALPKTFAKALPGTRSSSNVRSPDIPMHLAYYNYLRADPADIKGRLALAEKLNKELTRRAEVDTLFLTLAESFGPEGQSLITAPAKTPVVCDDRCCLKLQNAFISQCGGFDDYSLQYSRAIVNMCHGVAHDVNAADKLVSVMKTQCVAMPV